MLLSCRMERTFSLVNIRLMLLFMLIILIHGDVSQIIARASSPYKHTEVSDKDAVELNDPSLTGWLSEQHNIMKGSLSGRHHSFGNRDFRKRQPLVFPYSGERIRLRSHEHFVHSGLVEVYTAGEWGYVCDDGWDLTDADVACKELGFTKGAISATSTHGTLSESQRSSASILINDVQCSGTERSLQECPYSLMNICSSDEIAGVTCKQDVGCPKNYILGFGKCYKFYTNAKTIDSASRICAGDNASLVRIDSVKENHFLSNILQTSLPHIRQWYTGGRKTNNKWQWGIKVTENSVEKLIEDKRQGHSQPVFMDLSSEITFYKWFPGWPTFNNMKAEPTRKKGYNCLTLSNVYKRPLTKSSVVVNYFYWKASKCTSPNGMNFICQMTARGQEDATTNEANVKVRLLGGKDDNEGNVEVVIDNKRYGICDANWDTEEATVICRMLGFSSGGVATSHSYFSAEPKNVVLNYIDCNGTESHLSQCSIIVDDVNNDCSVEDLAGVICTKTSQLTTPSKVEGNSNKPISSASPGSNEQHSYGRLTFTLPSYRRKQITVIEKCGQRPLYDATLGQPRVKHQSIIYNVPDYLHKKLRDRIIGGNFVQHGAYPWQARFHLMFNSGFQDNISLGSHHCGGAIINQFWLLSAAHCFFNQDLDKIVVIVGDHNQKVKDPGEQIFPIEDVVTHEKYDDDTKDYDLALIRIKPTKNGHGIQFNNYVQPVCLPESQESFKDGMKCMVAGWGFLNPRQPGDDSATAEGYPMILKSIQVPLLSSNLCGNLYGPYNTRYTAERMLCAGYISGGIDSCDGDSGGPLVCKIGDVYTVAGITSWGRGCAMKNMPGVYSRISTFFPWIKKTVQSRSKNNGEKTFPNKP